MLSIKSLSFSYGYTAVLSNINLEIEDGEILCVLGESGSGKTSLLRLIAGLETHYQGEILLNRQDLAAIPVHQRGFGFMFQDFALFPHMNVFENVAFGLKMQGLDSKQRQKVVTEILDLLGMKDYQYRSIDALSGGQKQRVALARSLAPKPRLLLLDEPLGALDASLKEHLLRELEQIIKELGLTAIYVTHDQQEAFSIGDRIAIMDEGRIVQIDSPKQLYQQPNSPFVARFLGIANLVSKDVLSEEMRTGLAEIYLLHPDGLELDSNGELEGTVKEVIFQGERTRLKVILMDKSEIQLSIPSSMGIPNIGDTVRLTIRQDRILAMSNS